MPEERSSVGLILLLYAAGLGAAAQFAKIATSFPQLQALYPATEVTQGFLLSSISLIGAILGVVAGQLVAVYGHKKMMIFGLILGGCLSLFQASLPSLPLFLASRLLEGISHLVIVVAAPTLINHVTVPHQRYLSMTLWSSFFGVSFALLAWLSQGVKTGQDIAMYFGAHGAYMIVLAVILLGLLPRVSQATTPLPSLGQILKRHLTTYMSPFESPAALGWLFYTMTFVSALTILPPMLNESDQVRLAVLMPLASLASSFTLGVLMLRFLPAVTVVQTGFLAAGIAALWIFVFGIDGWILLSLFAALGLVQSASFAVIPALNSSATAQAHATGALAQTGNLGNLLGTPVLLGAMALFGAEALPILLFGCFGMGWGLHWVTKRARTARATP